MAGISIAGKTIIDEMLEEGGTPGVPHIDRNAAEREASRVLDRLGGYDSNIADIPEVPPVVIVRLGRYIVYIVVLPPGTRLTASTSLHIIEKLLPYLEKIKEHKLKPILIFYSRTGVLTKTAYLFLGSIIEAHGIGILFVNGSPDEILEILWSIDNKGEFTPEEEDYIELKGLYER